MEQQQLKVQIKTKKKQAQALREEAHTLDKEINGLKDKLKAICTHPSTKIVTQSYEEPGRVKYFEWREKVCKKCGKVLGKSEEKTTWTEFK